VKIAVCRSQEEQSAELLPPGCDRAGHRTVAGREELSLLSWVCIAKRGFGVVRAGLVRHGFYRPLTHPWMQGDA